MSPTDGIAAPTPVVTARGVERAYGTGLQTVHALRGVSLDIAAGDFVTLCGPSGSGKSTLLHILAGLDAPDAGWVAINGTQIDSRDEGARARLLGRVVGFVFQSFNLVPVLSAVENVELPLWQDDLPAARRRSMARAMLERVGLGDRLHHRPAALSGGQQQRVAVARALVPAPAIVFADEPTANLDGATADSLLGLMADLNRDLGTTFVFSTHDPRVIARARRRINLSDGEIQA